VTGVAHGEMCLAEQRRIVAKVDQLTAPVDEPETPSAST